jgi:hypothetical protein
MSHHGEVPPIIRPNPPLVTPAFAIHVSLTTIEKAISWISPLVSWSVKINPKVFFTSKDQYEAMIAAILKDTMIRSNHKGLRRAVRIDSST